MLIQQVKHLKHCDQGWHTHILQYFLIFFTYGQIHLDIFLHLIKEIISFEN